MEELSTEGMNERELLAYQFAKALANITIHDPSGKTSRRKQKSYAVPKKENIEKYLRTPSSSERNLRDASILLYQINTRYRNLINYYANLPCWSYVITPVNYNPDKTKRDNFKKQYLRACNFLESMSVEKTMRECVSIALREGVYYGAIWGGDGNSFILQKLNPDYCQIVSIGDGGVFQFKYDMSKILETDLDTYYPPEFTEMYKEYNRTGDQYQLVPREISVCIKADPTILEYSIPVFSGVLPSLYELENVKSLVNGASELSNYKLLAGVIPHGQDGVPLFDYQTVMQYYNHLTNNVGDRVGVAFTPFDLKSFSFEQSGTTAQIDNVARANENFFAEAGTSALLHGATNSTSGVTKLAIKVDEAYSFSLMYQAERVVNRILKNMPGTLKFKIHFLEVSQINRDEKIDQYRSAMNYGIGKLEFLAIMGIHQYDILGENYIENDVIGINELFKPMKTASTQSAEDAEAGRPSLSDSDISDEGEESRDNDTTSNR